jgi:hypothetical protein
MRMLEQSKIWRSMMSCVLGVFAIAITARGNLLDPNAVAWVEEMNNPAVWGTWNTCLSNNSNGTCTVSEMSEDDWGSAWVSVGEVDVSAFRYLSVDVVQIYGQTVLALAGPNSSDYEEMLTIQNPGRYVVDVSSWIGNESGTEEVYILLLPTGAGANVQCNEIKLGRVVEWSANMNCLSQWDNYNATVRAAGYNSFVQSNNMSVSWGKSWTYAGQVDVSSCKKILVTIPFIVGTAKVALSGPNDDEYTEYLTITEPGTYSAVVNNWEGNVEGSEDVFVQLIAEGQNAEIRYSEVTLGPDVVWSQDMQDVLEWNSWQSTLWANGKGMAILTESGVSSWGKSWINAGMQDLSISSKLHVRIPHINGGSLTVALSGPNDSYYQEFLTTSDPGEFLMDVSSWAGNGNMVFVQLIITGEGSSATLDNISFEK